MVGGVGKAVWSRTSVARDGLRVVAVAWKLVAALMGMWMYGLGGRVGAESVRWWVFALEFWA